MLKLWRSKHHQIVYVQVCLNFGLRGKDGATIVDNFLHWKIFGEIFENFFSKTILPEKLK